MNRRYPSSSLRKLLLLLVALAPLQAQAVFACAMMDTMIHDACCCDEHSGDPIAPEASDEPCCERSVGVIVDQDIRHSTPVGKAVEVPSDADPPQALISLIDALAPPQRVTPGVFYAFSAAGHSGSDTWLTTQRLRI